MAAVQPQERTRPAIPQARWLVLVRHAPSRPEPSRPANEWGLSEEGHAAARRLCALGLFDYTHGFYAGTAPKLTGTLKPVAAAHGMAVEADPAFEETGSAGWLGQETFAETVRRLFAAPEEEPAPGWESASAAVTRFTAGVERLVARHAPDAQRGHVRPGTFAVCSGGRMLTAYLAHVLGYGAERAFETWQALRTPDVAVVELAPEAAPRVVIPFGTLRV